MSRLILIIAIFALVYWLLTSPRRKQRQKDEPPKNQDMVSCAQCGVHLPKNESVLVEGKYYCSSAHSRGQSGN